MPLGDSLDSAIGLNLSYNYGKTDLLWKNGTNSRTQIWFMDGANQTSTSYFFGNGENWQVAGVADFNGDGNPDLL